jgi:hypothetical protein
MKKGFSISKAHFRRVIRTAATLPVPHGRGLVEFLLQHQVQGLVCADAPLQIGARTSRRDPDKAALAAKHFKFRKPFIQAFQTVLDRHLDYAKHETLRNIEEAHLNADAPVKSAEGPGVAADLIFDQGRFKDGLLGSMRAQSAETLDAAGQQLFDEVGYDDPFKMADKNALKFLDGRKNLMVDVADEIHDAINDDLAQGIEAGESTKALAQRISSKFEQISSGRAATVASTEAGAAFGYARDDAMRQAGIACKTWLTSHLPNVRAAHSIAEEDPRNARVPIDEPFQVGGEPLMYPGDEAGSAENVINCHCIALALAGEDEP